MLKVTHNAGFFSCCSIRLWEICQFFNRHRTLPFIVDSSEQFKWYKSENKNDDITYEYFKDNGKGNIQFYKEISYFYEDQYKKYNTLDFTEVIPFIRHYFSPSNKILDIVNEIENKYNLKNQYENLVVIFYRGNDKNTETTICSYEEIANKANEVLKKNSNLKFILQSDETDFLTYMIEKFPESIVFKDEIRHMSRCMNTVDKVTFKETAFHYSKYYLAITLIMAKCNSIICTSGNCSIWILFFRENARNVYQYLNDSWVQ